MKLENNNGLSLQVAGYPSFRVADLKEFVCSHFGNVFSSKMIRLTYNSQELKDEDSLQ
jgi:hypothetical protein